MSHSLLHTETGPKPPASPVQFDQEKHHDPNREPGILEIPNAEDRRYRMVRGMNGKYSWLSFSSFLDKFFCNPSDLYEREFPKKKLGTIRKSLARVVTNYKKRARKLKCQAEDQLASDFVSRPTCPSVAR